MFYCLPLQIEDAMLMFDKQTNRHRGMIAFFLFSILDFSTLYSAAPFYLNIEQIEK